MASVTSTTSSIGESRTTFGTDGEKQQPSRVYKRRRGLNGPLFLSRVINMLRSEFAVGFKF